MRNMYSVVRIWRLSLLFLLVHIKKLWQFILLPIVALSFVGVATSVSSNMLAVGMILNLTLYVMFAVAWHQFILTPASNRTVWQYLRWDKDKWRYLFICLLMAILAVLILNVTVRPTLWLLHSLNGLSLFFAHKPLIAEIPPLQWGSADIIATGVLLACCLPLSRLMMLLPASALGEAFDLRRIWALSGRSVGFCYLLFLSLCVSQLIFGYSGVALRYIIADLLGSGTLDGSDGGLSVRLIDELIWQCFNYLTVAILITPLSLAYGLLAHEKSDT